ncbi:MAG TPA: cytochrome P450, partial [Trebonia sp.]|nr:cytochrome P450 [Trebonia sp.]
GVWQTMIKFLGGLEWRPALPAQLEAVHASYLEMGALLQQFIDTKRQGTDSDLLRRLFAAQDEGLGVTDADLIGIISQLFTAGHQTTQDLLGNAVYTLLLYPDQWADIVADPSLVKNAVEEVLRFRSPAQDMERTAVHDVRIGDYTIAAGDHLTCLIGSANHDPGVFSDPGVFDIRRTDVMSHMAFSRGPHFCLGAALSRMEGAAGLTALARRFPEVSLADTDIRWMPNTHLMGVAALPLRFGPERG